MQFDPAEMSIRDIYFKMVQLITPRPIAWVSSLSNAGITNLAPFSFFNGVGANPPTIVFCPANRRDGSPKDTLRNIEQTGEFVVHVVPFAMAESMNQTAADYDSEISEIETCGLTTVASDRVQVPRLADAPAALECVLHQSIHLGSGPAGANLVIGRIVRIHVKDELFDDDGNINPAQLDTIGRLGGAGYSRTTERFELPRPTLPSQ
jgi:flavin reductase (DIM6/NTAB) family NADH-FMN oxidoreductase RutF